MVQLCDSLTQLSDEICCRSMLLRHQPQQWDAVPDPNPNPDPDPDPNPNGILCVLYQPMCAALTRDTGLLYSTVGAVSVVSAYVCCTCQEHGARHFVQLSWIDPFCLPALVVEQLRN